MDINIPEPYEVIHWTRPKVGKNPAGQVIYGDPVARARNVRGFEPATDVEVRSAQLAGRQITELVMLTADGDWPADSTVEFTWDGRKFEVNGPVRDYNLGPWEFHPGYAVELRRVNDGSP